MSHVDDGTLNALVDGQLDAHERVAVEAHLASCGDCARRFAEATALARQVTSLLATLDVPVPPLRTVPMPDAAPVVRPPARQPSSTLRRVAIAASVLLVAGVSYEMGRRDDGLTAPQATVESAPIVAMRDSNATAVGSADAASASVAAAPVLSAPAGTPPDAAAPTISVSPTAPRIAPTPAPAPSSDRVGVEQFAAPVTDARRAMVAEASKAADSRSAADAPAPVAAARRRMEVPAPDSRRVQANVARSGVASATGAVSASQALPGYARVDIAGTDALQRTQFVATDGVTLLLVIAPDSAIRTARAATANDTAFTVTTVDGRSTVTWASQGRTFELRGTLAPDSLLKLATLLR